MYNKDKYKVERLYGKPLNNKFKFNYYPLDHRLDKKQIKKFIEASDINVRDIVKKIFDNTIHISFEKFITRLNSNIYHLISITDINRPLFIYLGNIKNINKKSNYWLYLYLQNYIEYITNNSKSIILINESNINLLKKDDIIVLIDDCIYSGIQMAENISYINYNFKERYQFYLLVSFTSTYGLEYVKKTFKNNIFLKKSSLIICPYQFYLPIINDILSKKEIDYMNYFYQALYLSFDNKFLIYFDHKLADKISTITDFYLGVVPCIQNLKISNRFDIKINNLYKNIKLQDDKLREDEINHTNLYNFLNIERANIYSNYNDYYDYFIIIPVIKKCKNINIQPMSPYCPIPPYKSYFKNLIKFLKYNNHIKTKSLSLPRKNINIKPFISL